MATYDLTTGQGTAGHPSGKPKMYVMEKTIDWANALVAAGTALASSDVFQVLDIPAESFVMAAGAEVITVANATTCTVNIDFAAGDDIVDGGDIVGGGTGYLAAGTNGVIDLTAVSTFSNRIETADTIDVTLATLTGTLSTGKLRVYAVVCDISGVTETSKLASS